MIETEKATQTKQEGRGNHAANLQATAAGLPTVEEVARYLRAVEDLLAWAPSGLVTWIDGPSSRSKNFGP